MRRAAALLLLLAVTPALTPAQAQDALARLRSDLLSQNSATRTLANWCADLKLATPPVIHAAREPLTPRSTAYALVLPV